MYVSTSTKVAELRKSLGDEVKKEIARQKAMLVSIRKESGRATSIGRKFAKAVDSVVNVYITSYKPARPSFSVYVSVKSLKDPRLVNGLKVAMDFAGEGMKIEERDFLGASMREYIVEGQGARFEINASVPDKDAASAGQKCYRVQTGVKNVEQPIYEIVCEEGS